MKFDTILIDGNYWARKFFAVHKELLSRVDGKIIRTGLSHGFLIGLANLKEQYGGTITVCWDAGNTRRQEIDPEYKMERCNKREDQDDVELYRKHLVILFYFLKLLGIRQAKRKGEEADDVLYTLAKRSEGRTLIVSNDHDLYQALDRGVYQLVSKKGEEILYSARRLEREHGLTPRQYSYAMAIAGCSGDGVGGIPGVGIKTASVWVREWSQLVPALLGDDGTPLSEWLPETNSRNLVVNGTKFYSEGDKGPGKKLRTTIEMFEVVRKTERLTRLYDVWPISFSRNTYDEDGFVSALERVEMHECEARLDTLREIHK